MPASFKPFSSYFQEMGQPAGSPTSGQEYDIGGSGPATAASTGPPGAQTFGAPPSAPAAAPVSVYGSAPAPAAQSAPALSPYAPATSGTDLYGKLFSGIRGDIQGGETALGSAQKDFSAAAGQTGKTFGGIEGGQTLERALAPGQMDPGNQKADTQNAMGLLAAKYSGPQGLEQGAVDKLGGTLQGLNTRAQSLQSGAGVSDLLAGVAPGLTSGQTRMEAQRALRDQSYRSQAQAEEERVRALGSDFARAQEEAKALAAARTAEEAEIARLSKDYLTGSRATIDSDIERQVAGAKGDVAMSDAYKKFKETGSMEDLKALDALSDLDFSGFDTDLRKLDERGDAAWKTIEDDPKWASIKEVPLMLPGMNAHGRETLWFPKDWWQANKKKFPTKLPKNAPPGMMTRDELKAIARERQIEFEKAGFSPGTASFDRDTSRTPGEFAYTNPLYFTGVGGEDLNPHGHPYRTLDTPNFEPVALNEGDWVSMKDGTDPSRAGLANPEQRHRFNAIQELLGEGDRIEEGYIGPYEAPQLMSDMDRYVAEQQADYDARKGLIEADAKNFENTLNKFKLLN